METRQKLRFVITICVLMTCPSAAAMANVIYVDDDATGANDGSSWTDAFKSLQNALSVARPARPCSGGTFRALPRARLRSGWHRVYTGYTRSDRSPWHLQRCSTWKAV